MARDDDGQLRKISIPVQYLYVLVIGAVIGFLSLTGIASSYMRMLLKVSSFNQLRTEKEELKNRYSRLEQVANERDIQVASLGSLAGEVSALYGLKSDPILVTASAQDIKDAQVSSSLDQLYALRTSALSGAATIGISLGLSRNVTTADWLRASAAPNLWPVEGPVTGSFGERTDPFNGEGAFHSGVDVSVSYGQPVIAPADGTVIFTPISLVVMDERLCSITAMELVLATGTWRTLRLSQDSTCSAAIRSAMWDSAAAAQVLTSTTKSASTTLRSIPTNTYASPWPTPADSPLGVKRTPSVLNLNNGRGWIGTVQSFVRRG